MSLPRLPYGDNPNVQMLSQFAGLDHRLVPQGNAMWDMENMSLVDFPAIRTRKGRRLHRQLAKPNAFGARGDVLYWVDGTQFYYDGQAVATVSDSPKQIAKIGAYICIWPDKVYYNVNTGETKPLGASWSGTASFTAYTYDAEGDAAKVYQGNAIRGESAFPFEAGEAIVISGAANGANNRYATIREKLEQGRLLVFDNNTWIEDSLQPITVQREIPDMDYFVEFGNRLWGCKGDQIYASYLGMPWRWYNLGLGAADSWFTNAGTEGSFTGCSKLGGYPIFFKEDHIHKVYGSKPSNFSALENAVTGLLRTCDQSIANAGEGLYYVGRNGVVAYSGGIPYDIGEALGVEIVSATAGSDGRRYYLSAETPDGAWNMYVFDSKTRLWTKEDHLHVVNFATAAGTVYALGTDGGIYALDGEDERDMPWMIETGDIIDGGPDKEEDVRVQLRAEIRQGYAECYVQYDSDGKWIKANCKMKAGPKQSYILPVIPRRCDHYRIRIKGKGSATIYNLTRTTRQGSML